MVALGEIDVMGALRELIIREFLDVLFWHTHGLSWMIDKRHVMSFAQWMLLKECTSQFPWISRYYDGLITIPFNFQESKPVHKLCFPPKDPSITSYLSDKFVYYT